MRQGNKRHKIKNNKSYRKACLPRQPRFATCIFTSILLLSVNSARVAHADGATKDDMDGQALFELDLETLMDIPITAASGERNALSQEQAPGVVTVITRREIEALGVTNLFELMRFVPGFDRGINESGLSTFQVRGNYAGEGQVQINYNGVPVNEGLYDSPEFAGHHSIAHIDRVEIIRGPGSALYGGTAELGVINVISRKPKNTGYASIQTSKIAGPEGYKIGQLGAGLGDPSSDAFSSYFHAGVNRRDTTKGPYIGYDGTRFENGAPFWAAESEMFQFGLSGAGFSLSTYYADLKQSFPLQYYDTVANDGTYAYDTSIIGNVTYRAFLSELSYQKLLSESVHFDASIRYGNYDSGIFNGAFTEIYPEWFYEVPSQSLNMEVKLNIKNRRNGVIDIGYGLDQDRAQHGEKMASTLEDIYGLPTRAGELAFDTHYLFAQLINSWDDLTLTTGFRSEKREGYGSATVPRVAMTFTNKPWHYKLLASRAYRSPSIGALALTGGSLESETATVYEMEAGYRFNDSALINMNIFFNQLEDVLVYDDNSVRYTNEGDVDTKGLEVKYRYHTKQAFLVFNFSRYVPVKNTVADYQVRLPAVGSAAPNTPVDKLIGAAQTKFSIYGQYRLNDQLSVNPSLIFLGERFSIANRPNQDTWGFVELDPSWLANINVKYDSLRYKGLTTAIGIKNIAGEEDEVSVGYLADGIPHPQGLGRQVTFKISLEF